MKYPKDFINKIICDDCLEMMKGMPDNCIDAITTDPPYGLEFMGKGWDKFPIRDRGKRLTGGGNPTEARGFGKNVAYGNSKESLIAYQKFSFNWATEALRVAKPGATLLCFGGARTYHRLACAIEDAGWILKDCIMWLYGSGFPKATDIGKQIDKRAGVRGKIIGYKKTPDGKDYLERNKEGRGKDYGDLYGNYELNKGEIRELITPEATFWNGWKSHGLKPAYEPILVAMKPNEGSYANNALKYGVAGLNVDGGRIKSKVLDSEKRTSKTGFGIWNKGNKRAKEDGEERHNPKGRYPANVILDEEAGRLLDEQSGNCRSSGIFNRDIKAKNNWMPKGNGCSDKMYNDSGGASRFFYCAKASKAERNKGCEELYWKKDNSSFGYHQIDGQEWEWLGREEERIYKETGNRVSLRARGNIHPTVKSLALVRYLIKLTSMPNKSQIYLDPFFGSGTTGMACKESKRDYIGIDNNAEYCKIARRRVNAIPESLF